MTTCLITHRTQHTHDSKFNRHIIDSRKRCFSRSAWFPKISLPKLLLASPLNMIFPESSDTDGLTNKVVLQNSATYRILDNMHCTVEPNVHTPDLVSKISSGDWAHLFSLVPKNVKPSEFFLTMIFILQASERMWRNICKLRQLWLFSDQNRNLVSAPKPPRYDWSLRHWKSRFFFFGHLSSDYTSVCIRGVYRIHSACLFFCLFVFLSVCLFVCLCAC